MQNNLSELWSLFDFVYPMKLGTLQDFMRGIADPVRRGGYVNATDLQIKIAYKCTVKLRDTIKPYLLRRTKEDVNQALQLPPKSEQMLFCKLTDKQRDVYTRFLATDIIREISRGDAQVFSALIKVRKICNHPYLFSPLDYENDPFRSDFFKESGKMLVVHSLLKLW